MGQQLPHLSTDQIAAFVELARHGQIRTAASGLGITEQGLRNRLIALESQLGAELYRKRRGPRRLTPLTEAGQRFLPHALAFLERAHELCHAFEIQTGIREIRIGASQYLIRYLLIDVLTQFAAAEPAIHVRVSTMAERDVEASLLSDPEMVFGLAAPYESSPDLEYTDLFAMPWSLITPIDHRLKSRRSVRLSEIAGLPLILYERGSTGRQHVLDAFHEAALSPRIALETTSTETVVSMVEAGLGVALVPLLPSGTVTRNRRVTVVRLVDPIRPIHSGVLRRKRETLSPAAARLLSFIAASVPGVTKADEVRRRRR